MASSFDLRAIFDEACPIIAQQLDLAEIIKGFRETATAKGLDWSQIKALLKAQIEDERAGETKRVERIVEKAEFASAYAEMLGLANLNEFNFSAANEVATTQRENVPTQHEVRPGSTSPGTEQQCDTLGVTAGETANQSEQDGGAIAAVKGQARPASVVDAEPSPSSIFAVGALRPHCQRPDNCGGYGRKHCGSCERASKDAEAVPA